MTAKSLGLAAVLIVIAGSVAAQEQSAGPSGAPPAADRQLGASASRSAADFRSVDEQIQAIKKEVLALGADLFVLEEELLYPANSQVAFFVSMDVGEYFDLETVTLEIDGTAVANYLYTDREVGALSRGGVQRLHVENLNAGEHEIAVVLAGESARLKNYRRDAVIDIEKGIGAMYVELEITDRVARQEPEFVIKQWE